MWGGYRDDMNDLAADMESSLPSEKYQTTWDKMEQVVRNLAKTADALSCWDTNGDGEYTSEEASSVNDTAILLYNETCQSMLEEDAAYKEAKGISTPRPTATPKRSTSKSNSDPYNAGDYNNPEFFYDDWYDDFYDYDEAEEYWEDYGDG